MSMPVIIHDDWRDILEDMFTNELLPVSAIMDPNVTPIRPFIFRCLEMPPSQVRVVILGQSPYPRKGVACGYSFAVSANTNHVPPSLKIIEEELGGPVDPTLRNWRDQGVLLLNKTLTTLVGHTDAHVGVWSDWTDELCRRIDDVCRPTWMLWGKKAQSVLKVLPENAYYMTAPHPVSEHYARKQGRSPTGFIGCAHFYNTRNMIKW